MRIAVNTRFLLKGKLEGMGVFTHESLKRICQNHPEHEFMFYFDRSFDDKFIYSDNIKPRILFPQARHPFLWYLWFEFSVARQLKKDKADLFLSPDGYLSLRTNIPQIPVIHDLAFEHYPKDVAALSIAYYQKYFPKYARKAKRIATVSEYSKKDIVDQYGIDDGVIDVVYNGANKAFRELGEAEKQEVKEKFSAGSPYFVYVGAMHQRKNIIQLLKGFEEFKKRKGSNYKLILVGRKAWGNREMEEYYEQMKFKEAVIFTGRLSLNELAKVVGSARGMTYLSYFEGFGIPLVEAMQCGVPVLTSDRSSLPEVAGNGGICIDPFDTKQIAQSLSLLAFDEKTFKGLQKRAMDRSKVFSWDKTAERLWACVEKALNI